MTSQVYRRYDDGFLVRRMTEKDAEVAVSWYMTLVDIFPRDDIFLCLRVFPPDIPGFYVGEVGGEVVACAVRIPWGKGIYYGSFYFVAEKHRRKGYGTRLRDEVARDHVGTSILCIDAMPNTVPKNRELFGYVEAFTTSRWQGVVTETRLTKNEAGGISLTQAQNMSFDAIIQYDDKHFVCSGSDVRRAFMKEWVRMPGGKCMVAMDPEGHVTGFGCRRRCSPSGHIIGPLYADTADVASSVMHALCRDVIGETVVVIIWNPNEDAIKIMEQMEFTKQFESTRMHLNGDPREFKPSVFALTSLLLCGF